MSTVVRRSDPVAPASGVRARRRYGLRRARNLLGVVPFLAFVGVFLATPTAVVVIGAFAVGILTGAVGLLVAVLLTAP